MSGRPDWLRRWGASSPRSAQWPKRSSIFSAPNSAIANAAGRSGQAVLLRGLLRRYPDAAKLSGKTLTFKMEGATVGTAVTGTDGLARLNYTLSAGLGTGTRTITVEFAGDSAYNAGTGAGTLTVNP